MEFVITKGQLQLQPIPGEPVEEAHAELEPRAGYLLRIVDQDSGITFVVSMGYQHLQALGQTMVDDVAAHPEGKQPGPEIQVAGPAHLAVLKDHLGPGGVPRQAG